jgi:hypothetical protein
MFTWIKTYLLYIKIAIALVLIIAFTVGFFYVKGKLDTAAKVPALQAAIVDKQARIDYAYGQMGIISNKLTQIQTDRDTYHINLLSATIKINDLMKDLQNAKKNSPVSNIICSPTNAERKLFNDTANSISK